MTVLGWLALAPEPITRDGAREDAVRELRDRIYRSAEPSLADQLIDKIFGWIVRELARAAGFLPGGIPSLVILGLLVLGFFIALRLGLGPLARQDALADRRRGAREFTAADYRGEAERLAADGDFREALRARFRAVVRELEQRGVLDPRPGRTASEIAVEAGAAVVTIAKPMKEGARLFNAVWYGGQTADRDTYERMTGVDHAVLSARLAVAR